MPHAATRDRSSADRVAGAIRDLIVTGHLAPGTHIRQEQMAEDLGVSRAPLREALKQLSSEGLVSHLHNSGYAVERLNRDQFDQIYLMRRLFETEVIMMLPPFSKAGIARLARLHEAVAEASARHDLPGMQLYNHDFHFAMFRHSGLTLVVSELERLWRLASPYHMVYLYDSAARDRLIGEHAAMVEALREGDNERVAAIMNDHRLGGEQHISLRFERPRL
jgi:DNA-binding GntR family transcriptional regulator